MPLLGKIIKLIAPPKVSRDKPFAMVVSLIICDTYRDRVKTGRVCAEAARLGDTVHVVNCDGVRRSDAKIIYIMAARGLPNEELQVAGAGDIVSNTGVCGMCVIEKIGFPPSQRLRRIATSSFESTVEAIKTLGHEKLTWDDVCSRLIEVAKTSQNKLRDVALTGREIIIFDFCDKRGHEAGRCWKNQDNLPNRPDSSSDAGHSRINKHKKNAAKVAKESKSAARASKAYKSRKRPDSSSNESSSSNEDSDARRFRLDTAHAVSSTLSSDAAQQSSRIVLDSGASTHMCPHETWFKVLRSRKRTDILLGDDSNIARNKKGTIHFSMGFRDKIIRFALENVLFTPGLKHSIFSCSALSSAGCETLFTANHCTLIDSKTRSGPGTIARIRPRNGMYYVPAVAHIKQRHAAHSTSSNFLRDGDKTSVSTGPAAQLAHNEVVDRWHCRLGHAGRNRLRELMRNGEQLTIPDMPICYSCVRRKQSRDRFTGSISTATKPGDIIHSDVSGPLPRSNSGYRYTVSFIDEHNRYVTVFAMKRKSDVLGFFK
jgi:GAG-pre-integrase domain